MRAGDAWRIIEETPCDKDAPFDCTFVGKACGTTGDDVVLTAPPLDPLAAIDEMTAK